MQRDKQSFPQIPLPPFGDQVGGDYIQNAPFSSFYGGTHLPQIAENFMSFRNVDFHPSDICPRNFVIFDRTDNQSQIMFHPTIAPKFCYPGLNLGSPYNIAKRSDEKENLENLSFMKEDSADIDALLSSDEEEDEECDEEEVSTGRTPICCDDGDSADSWSKDRSKLQKSMLPSSSQKSTDSGCSERKRQKMRKMVRTLRGIVPGGNRMNTVAVLDEAVRYLKSLKVEAQKLGAGNLKC